MIGEAFEDGEHVFGGLEIFRGDALILSDSTDFWDFCLFSSPMIITSSSLSIPACGKLDPRLCSSGHDFCRAVLISRRFELFVSKNLCRHSQLWIGSGRRTDSQDSDTVSKNKPLRAAHAAKANDCTLQCRCREGIQRYAAGWPTRRCQLGSGQGGCFECNKMQEHIH